MGNGTEPKNYKITGTCEQYKAEAEGLVCYMGGLPSSDISIFEQEEVDTQVLKIRMAAEDRSGTEAVWDIFTLTVPLLDPLDYETIRNNSNNVGIKTGIVYDEVYFPYR